MTERHYPDPAECQQLTEQDLAIATLVGRYIERREQSVPPRVHDLLAVAAEFGHAAVEKLRTVLSFYEAMRASEGGVGSRRPSRLWRSTSEEAFPMPSDKRPQYDGDGRLEPMSAANASPIVEKVLRFEDLPLGSCGTRRAIVRWGDGSESEALTWYDDLCGHPHKSSYADPRVMPSLGRESDQVAAAAASVSV